MSNNNGWLVIPDKPLPLDQCAILVRRVAGLRKEWQFRIGELAEKMEMWHGESSWQVIGDLGYGYNTIQNWKFTYRRCHENYTPALPFTYWQALAAVDDPAKQEQFVTRCMAEGWNRQDLRDALEAFLKGDTEKGDTEPASNDSDASELTADGKAALFERVGEAMVPVAELIRKAIQEGPRPATVVALQNAWDELVSAGVALFEKL